MSNSVEVNSSEALAKRAETMAIREEIRHLTRRQWRVAVYVILFIVGTGAFFRHVHLTGVAHRNGGRNVSDTR